MRALETEVTSPGLTEPSGGEPPEMLLGEVLTGGGGEPEVSPHIERYSVFLRREVPRLIFILASAATSPRERADMALVLGRALNDLLGELDPHTGGHQERVAGLAGRLARQLGLRNEMVRAVELAGLLHDVGKYAVPFEILNRPGPLNEDEMAVVRRHAADGAAMLRQLEFPEEICQMVHQHHERIDGTGYPAGLVGEQVVLGSQIIALADVYDAIYSPRPYRDGLGQAAALEELQDGAGTRYSAPLVAAFHACLGKEPAARTVGAGIG